MSDLAAYVAARKRPEDTLAEAKVKGAEGEFAVKLLPSNDLTLRRRIWQEYQSHALRAKSGPFKVPGDPAFDARPTDDIILDCTRLANRILTSEGKPALGLPATDGFLAWLRTVYTDPDMFASAREALDALDYSPEELEALKNASSAALEKTNGDGAATTTQPSDARSTPA